jgi:hypothetical protein
VPDVIPTLQTAVSGADATLYAYGLVGAALPVDQRPDALDAMADVRVVRDRLRELIAAAGATPAPAAAAYDPPFAVTGERSARRLAGLVEDRLAGQLAAVAGVLDGSDRRWAAAATQESGRRAVGWTGEVTVWFGRA